MYWRLTPDQMYQYAYISVCLYQYAYIIMFFRWHDGISTFYLDGTGVVYKHKMDRVSSTFSPWLYKKNIAGLYIQEDVQNILW